MGFADNRGLPSLEKDWYYGIIIVLVILYIACAYFGMCLKTRAEVERATDRASGLGGLSTPAGGVPYEGNNKLYLGPAGGTLNFQCDSRSGQEKCGTGIPGVAGQEPFMNGRATGPAFFGTNTSLQDYYSGQGVTAQSSGERFSDVQLATLDNMTNEFPDRAY